MKNVNDKFKKILEEKSKDNESLIIMLYRLNQSIKAFNEKSSSQTKWIIWLTVILGGIALLHLILFFAQL